MKKNIIHEPRNEAQNFLTRANKYKEQPELFTLIRDEKGNLIDTVNGNSTELSRKDELRGEGIEYLTSFIDFMCTHHKDNIEQPEQGQYYSINDIDFSGFLTVVTGGHKDQRRRAVISLYHIIENPKPKLIRSENGDCYRMQPFVITLKLNGQAINEAMKKRVNNLKDNHSEDPAKVIEGMVSTIDILFAKPLFEGFFKKGGYISLPTALYALVLNELHGHAMLARGEVPEPMKAKCDELYPNDDTREWMTQLDSSQNISETTDFIRYICLHNNITKEQHKNKLAPFTVKTTLEIIPMLKEVAPRLLRREDGNIHYRQQEFTNFITGILSFTSMSDAFKEAADFRIIGWELCNDDKIQLILTNDKDAIYRWKKKTEHDGGNIYAIKKYIEIHPNATTKQIAKSLNMSQRTVQRYLKVIYS